jgi:hypothetical protein
MYRAGFNYYDPAQLFCYMNDGYYYLCIYLLCLLEGSLLVLG